MAHHFPPKPNTHMNNNNILGLFILAALIDLATLIGVALLVGRALLN